MRRYYKASFHKSEEIRTVSMNAVRMNKGKAIKKNILIACLTWYPNPASY
jgi:hypothetical protein